MPHLWPYLGSCHVITGVGHAINALVQMRDSHLQDVAPWRRAWGIPFFDVFVALATVLGFLGEVSGLLSYTVWFRSMWNMHQFTFLHEAGHRSQSKRGRMLHLGHRKMIGRGLADAPLTHNLGWCPRQVSCLAS